MITYPSISGPVFAVLNEPCLAFHKYDGSNLRFFWRRQRGWHRYGTRYRWFDESNPMFGPAVKLFHDNYAQGILDVLRRHKEYRNVTELVAIGEFFGPSTFSGLHREDEPKELVLFDIWLPERGLVPPKDFAQHFGQLRIAEVVYEGPFNRTFIEEVQAGKYPVQEGVVAKGVVTRRARKGKAGQEVWAAKVKTRAWLEELRQRSAEAEDLLREYEANLREQSLLEGGAEPGEDNASGQETGA